MAIASKMTNKSGWQRMFLRVCDVTMSQFIFLRGFVLKPTSTSRAEILWAAVGTLGTVVVLVHVLLVST